MWVNVFVGKTFVWGFGGNKEGTADFGVRWWNNGWLIISHTLMGENEANDIWGSCLYHFTGQMYAYMNFPWVVDVKIEGGYGWCGEWGLWCNWK